jgi:cellulose/xylan binding protein with CBM9 domain
LGGGKLVIAALWLAFMAAQQAPQPTAPNPANVIESLFAQKDWEPDADPQSLQWSGISGVQAAKDYFGETVTLDATEIRSRWTRKYLYLLFICPYDELNLKPNPSTTEETDKLWNWDVAEAFIGSDYLNPSRYKEFQASPQGEYVDLEIDHANPNTQKGVEWNSGFTVKGRIDSQKKIWYAEMRIPFAAIDPRPPKATNELRIGLFRICGTDDHRRYISWRPTNARTFHVPEAFGSLVLMREPEDKEKEKDKEQPK